MKFLHGARNMTMVKCLNKGNCIKRSILKRSNAVLIVTGKEVNARLSGLRRSLGNCWNKVNRLELYNSGQNIAETEGAVYKRYISKRCSRRVDIHRDGGGLFVSSLTDKTINADLNGVINILDSPESDEDGAKWLNEGATHGLPLGAGRETTSNGAMKAINHEPRTLLGGTAVNSGR